MSQGKIFQAIQQRVNVWYHGCLSLTRNNSSLFISIVPQLKTPWNDKHTFRQDLCNSFSVVNKHMKTQNLIPQKLPVHVSEILMICVPYIFSLLGAVLQAPVTLQNQSCNDQD